MIPIAEFVRLERDARKAFADGDLKAVERINARLAIANCAVYQSEGEVYLLVIEPDTHLPFEDGA